MRMEGPGRARILLLRRLLALIGCFYRISMIVIVVVVVVVVSAHRTAGPRCWTVSDGKTATEISRAVTAEEDVPLELGLEMLLAVVVPGVGGGGMLVQRGGWGQKVGGMVRLRRRLGLRLVGTIVGGQLFGGAAAGQRRLGLFKEAHESERGGKSRGRVEAERADYYP